MSTPQQREPDPADELEQADIDRMTEYPIEQVGPDERARIHAMTVRIAYIKRRTDVPKDRSASGASINRYIGAALDVPTPVKVLILLEFTL